VIDWKVSLPFARDISEVGSIGHPGPLCSETYAAGGTHRPLGASGGGEVEIESDS